MGHFSAVSKQVSLLWQFQKALL